MLSWDRIGQKPDASRLIPTIPGEWLAVQMGISGVVVLTLMIHAGLVITENPPLAMICSLMLALGAVRFVMRHSTALWQKRLRDFAEYAFLFFGTGLLGVVASYPAAAGTTGLSDPALEHVDRIFHFDWLAWYRFVAEHASLQLAGSAAYAAIYVSPLLLLGYFAIAQHRSEARRFLVTFWLAGMLTLALFPEFPAEGPLAFLWHGPIPYMPVSALYAEHLIPALRSHQITSVDMGALRGLVCAPSFHTVSAVLYIVAAWPIRALRWPLLLINLAMIAAIPIEGTHYLSDMLVGMVVAVVAIVTVGSVLHVLRRVGTERSGAQ